MWRSVFILKEIIGVYVLAGLYIAFFFKTAFTFYKLRYSSEATGSKR